MWLEGSWGAVTTAILVCFIEVPEVNSQLLVSEEGSLAGGDENGDAEATAEQWRERRSLWYGDVEQ